jgi:hypothetical protein
MNVVYEHFREAMLVFCNLAGYALQDRKGEMPDVYVYAFVNARCQRTRCL